MNLKKTWTTSFEMSLPNPGPGYTQWHLLAAGLLSQEEAMELLTQSRHLGDDLMVKRLSEPMTEFPVCGIYFVNNDSERSDEELRSVCRGRTPLEISKALERPLLAGYHWKPSWLHPVVRRAWEASCHSLGLDPQMMQCD